MERDGLLGVGGDKQSPSGVQLGAAQPTCTLLAGARVSSCLENKTQRDGDRMQREITRRAGWCGCLQGTYKVHISPSGEMGQGCSSVGDLGPGLAVLPI